MLTLDERMMIGFKVLERLRPTLHRSSQRQKNQQRWNLHELIRDPKFWAPGSAILGACEDGLPFVLDLNNPAPGSILIAGEKHSGKSRLLRAILSSIILLNTPEQVSFRVLARRSEEYSDFEHAANCQGLLSSWEEGVTTLILSMAEISEQRRRSCGRQGATIILAIDDLVSLVQSLDHQALASLCSLTRHGPRSQIWVLATLPTDQIDWVDEHLLATFRTRLLGSRSAHGLAQGLSSRESAPLDGPLTEDQFYAPFADGWMRFWISSPD